MVQHPQVVDVGDAGDKHADAGQPRCDPIHAGLELRLIRRNRGHRALARRADVVAAQLDRDVADLLPDRQTHLGRELAHLRA